MISVVIATLNRLSLLRNAVMSLGVIPCEYETIIVDGGSTDGTEEWCQKREGLVFIQQGEPLGAIAAFNAGFAAATHERVVNLNDDSFFMRPDPINAALDILEHQPHVGQVALPFKGSRVPHPKIDRVYFAKRYWPYANFGVTRKALGDRLGWWGNRYKHYAGDPELSLKIWDAGWIVATLPLEDRYCLWHEEVYDATRQPNSESDLFYQNWKDWKGPTHEDPISL